METLLKIISQHVRQKLSSNCNLHLSPFFETHKENICSLVMQSVNGGGGTSCLLCAPRGSGKTVLIEEALRDVRCRLGTADLHVIRLNGLLQSDTKTVLCEIQRQLRETFFTNGVGDTVDTTLATRSVKDNLQLLLTFADSEGTQSPVLVFVLDEFDQFCLGEFQSQLFLYNLFDITKNGSSRICLICVSSRLDVTELMEKRVRSRFSHRKLLFTANDMCSFDSYVQLFSSYLIIDAQSLSAAKSIQSLVAKWNHHCKALFDNSAVKDVLYGRFVLTSDLFAVKHLVWWLLCTMKKNCIAIGAPGTDMKPERHLGRLLSVQDVLLLKTSLTDDYRQRIMADLPQLELLLLICIDQHVRKYPNEATFNFEMVFAEYTAFISQRTHLTPVDRSIALKAFERLCGLELVDVATTTATGRARGRTNLMRCDRQMKEFMPLRVNVAHQELVDVVAKHDRCPAEVKHFLQVPVLS